MEPFLNSVMLRSDLAALLTTGEQKNMGDSWMTALNILYWHGFLFSYRPNFIHLRHPQYVLN